MTRSPPIKAGGAKDFKNFFRFVLFARWMLCLLTRDWSVLISSLNNAEPRAKGIVPGSDSANRDITH